MAASAPHATAVPGRAPALAATATRENHRALAAIVLFTAIGAALRIAAAGQSLFGDELSTEWIVTTHGLGGVIQTVHDEIEITPPLYFVAAWIATRIQETPELLRLPSLIAGIGTIPLVYALGRRTVGRDAAVVAAALTALSPFLIFYSSEARAYQLMIVLVMLSTAALLAALGSGRTRWWAAYAACTCLAVYAHYTSVFALGAQLLWVLWAHPEARGRAIAANAAAVVAFLPWTAGLRNDFALPDSGIMSELSPLTLHNLRLTVEHWSVGYPYVTASTELRDLPGIPGLAMQALGLLVAIVAVAARRPSRPGRGLVLVAAMALAAPAGQLLVSAVGTNLLTTRNLAVAWPWFALALAALLVAPGPRLRVVTVGLVVAGFALGGAKMAQTQFARPDFAGAARTVEPDAVAIDAAIAFITPGPLTGLEAGFGAPRATLRAGAPEVHDRNFRYGEYIAPVQDVVGRATGSGRRVAVVAADSEQGDIERIWDALFAQAPGGYRRTEKRVLPGFIPLAVLTYDPPR